MLVLSRQVGERIKAGELWITVVSCEKGKVRLGFEGKREIRVLREEVCSERYEPVALKAGGGQ